MPRAPTDSVNVEPLRVTVEEAARILGISRTKLYNHMRAGKIKSTRDGGRTLFLMAELRRYVKQEEK